MELSVNELLTKELNDEVIVFQTDTVYGIGALLNSEKGVKKIYQVKSREDKMLRCKAYRVSIIGAAFALCP